jgi:hypothetical protein
MISFSDYTTSPEKVPAFDRILLDRRKKTWYDNVIRGYFGNVAV